MAIDHQRGLSLKLFGDVEVRKDGVKQTALDAGQRRWILTSLVLHQDGRSAAQMYEMFWPHRAPDPNSRGRPSYRHLHWEICHIRTDVFGAEFKHLLPNTKTNEPYRLIGDGLRCDVWRFTELLAIEGQAGDAERQALLFDAVSLYDGPLAADYGGSHFDRERQRLRKNFVDAVVAYANLAFDVRGQAEAFLREQFAKDKGITGDDVEEARARLVQPQTPPKQRVEDPKPRQKTGKAAQTFLRPRSRTRQPGPRVPVPIWPMAIAFGLLFFEQAMLYAYPHALWWLLSTIAGVVATITIRIAFRDPPGKDEWSSAMCTMGVVFVGGIAAMTIILLGMPRLPSVRVGPTIGNILKDCFFYDLLAGAVWNFWIRWGQFRAQQPSLRRDLAVSLGFVLFCFAGLVVSDVHTLDRYAAKPSTWLLTVPPTVHLWVREPITILPTVVVFWWSIVRVRRG